jgi:predicted alpha/beta hydrolase family esterase
MSQASLAPVVSKRHKTLSWQHALSRTAIAALNRAFPAIAEELIIHYFFTPRKKKLTYHKTLPVGARRISIPYKQMNLHGYEWGRGERTVLLVHGWESHIGFMVHFVESLVQQGLRVVAFDAPGHGFSPRARTDAVDFGQAIQAVIAHIGGVHGLVAHSYGAMATLHLLASQPQFAPQKLALISPLKNIQEHLFIFHQIAQTPRSLAARAERRIVRQYPVPLDAVCSVQAAEVMTSQGLILHDSSDTFIPYVNGQEIAAAWGADFALTRKLGHYRILRDPAVIQQITAFMV